tara:strand:+ start:79 stop:621 length:543 start_codon:yes stop_codon:yes gene_type:complete
MMAIIAFLLGIFSWTLTEYFLHRFLGHVYGKNTPFGKLHRKHHAEKDYFDAPINKFKTAIKVVLIMGLVGNYFFGILGGAFTVGFVLMYGAYEYLHHLLHVKAPVTAYGRWARRHHFYHHFEKPTHNHGVTSPLWDIVFGTYAKPRIVRVPRKFVMRWLTDGHEKIWRSLRSDYSLRGQR